LSRDAFIAGIIPAITPTATEIDMSARGFGLGLASHGIGTARAMSRNETAGVFAALALGLNGIATSILVPLLFKLLNLF